MPVVSVSGVLAVEDSVADADRPGEGLLAFPVGSALPLQPASPMTVRAAAIPPASPTLGSASCVERRAGPRHGISWV